MTLEIPTQLEAAIERKAQQQGVSPHDYALDVLSRETQSAVDSKARWEKFFSLAAQLPRDVNAPSISEDQMLSWVDEARAEREAQVWHAAFGATTANGVNEG